MLRGDLSISDHSLLNIRPNAYLSAYREAGGTATLGYGNGWLISNDADCVMTGGWRAGGASDNCTGPWAMAQNLAEGVMSGASYMVLDLADLLRPDYYGVLRGARDFLLAHPGGSPRLVPKAQQDMSRWARAHVAVAQPSLEAIEPPIRLAGPPAAPVGFVSETPEAGLHEISTRFQVPKSGSYAFFVFAGVPKNVRVRNARWVKITVQAEGAGPSQGVFVLSGKVQESYPVPVAPASNDRAKVNGGPDAAQTGSFMNDRSWDEFSLRFQARAASAVKVSIRLVAPNLPVRNGGGYRESYPGDPSHGIAFWSPQLVEVTSP
jgi:hypothetical protein